MANMHDVNKRFVSFSAERELIEKVDAAAAVSGLCRTEFVVRLMNEATRNVTLSEVAKCRVRRGVAEAKARRGM